MCSEIAGIKYSQRAVGRVKNGFAHSKRPTSISWSSTPNSSKSVAVRALLGERARQADADSLRATAVDIRLHLALGHVGAGVGRRELAALVGAAVALALRAVAVGTALWPIMHLLHNAPLQSTSVSADTASLTPLEQEVQTRAWN